MKVLSIGNSFSQDAQRYLHALAKHNGVQLKSVNLYIGGCTLRSHYINMLDDDRAYDFEFNGEKTGIKISIREALVSDEWDFITLQQASLQSTSFDTYTPYVEALAEYVRKYCPHAKLLLHETWAYEAGSDRLLNWAKYDTPEAMMSAVRASYEAAANAIGADGMIPCGEAMLRASRNAIFRIHRDSFHASLGMGRYLLALCWFKYLTGLDILPDSFNGFDAPVSDEERAAAIEAVNYTIGEDKKWTN